MENLDLEANVIEQLESAVREDIQWGLYGKIPLINYRLLVLLYFI